MKAPFPYLIDPHITLTLTGRWAEGGILEMRSATGEPLTIPLPASLWAVSAILVQAAKDAGAEDWARAFVTVDELAFLLFKKTGLGNHDPENAVRLVFRLRHLLAKSEAYRLETAPEFGAKDWSKRLVERQRFLGYRISVPPRNLKLEVLEGLPLA